MKILLEIEICAEAPAERLLESLEARSGQARRG
jgi:hypothetical protein